MATKTFCDKCGAQILECGDKGDFVFVADGFGGPYPGQKWGYATLCNPCRDLFFATAEQFGIKVKNQCK